MKKSNVGDRISALPDSIIHHIFSFLDMRVVVQTTFLSKRWESLWMSTPYLNFKFDVHTDEDYDTPPGEVTLKRNDFTDFVNRVLILHDDAGMHKLSVSSDERFTANHVYTWLTAALQRQVKELYFKLLVTQHVEVPRRLFASDITVLTMVSGFNRWDDVHLRMPKSMCSAAKIKSLHLGSVKFPDGDLNGELILSCPVLETLVLCECDCSHLNILTISAIQLKELIFTNDESSAASKINICSPNLTSIICKGMMHTDFSLKNGSFLISAHIDFFQGYWMEKDVYAQCLIRILKEVYNVNTLKLSSSVFGSINRSPDILEMLPKLLPKLRKIIFEDYFVGDHVPFFTANILKRLPCVEAFVWERGQYVFSRRRELRDNGGADLTVQCTLSCLKTVEVKNFHGMEHELKFLKFLLLKAVFLKEMIIKISPQATKKFPEISEKLLALPRASSSVLIHIC